LNRSFDIVSGGSAGAHLETHKLADGSYKVTSPTVEGQEWTAPTEQEAIQIATQALYDMACRGEI
jgi:hypothetical protein